MQFESSALRPTVDLKAVSRAFDELTSIALLRALPRCLRDRLSSGLIGAYVGLCPAEGQKSVARAPLIASLVLAR
jgi:hypothetical protein